MTIGPNPDVRRTRVAVRSGFPKTGYVNIKIGIVRGVGEIVNILVCIVGFMNANHQIGPMSERKPIPDQEFYAPVFSPWLGWGEFRPLYLKAGAYTVVSADRCWILYALAKKTLHLPGNLYEAGVYKGGTAIILRHVMLNAAAASERKILRLFDTFEGMPDTDAARDLHKSGDFRDTDIEAVMRIVGTDEYIAYHQGFIPDTFSSLEGDRICFAHVDVDIYQSILDTCAFVYPRLSASGFMLFDDYGFPTCPGARQAVDEYFSDKPEVPLILPTGQAIVTKCAL